MSDENKQESVSNAQIMLSIGKLVGTMEAVNTSISAIRTDIQRLDQTSSDRLARVEDNLVDKIKDQGVSLNKRIDGLEKNVGENISGLSTRVTALEAEDKKIIKDVATMSAMGGGIGGALVTAAVELIKHL